MSLGKLLKIIILPIFIALLLCCGIAQASSVIMSNGTYESDETDLKVPARGLAIDWTRNYRSNRIMPTATGAVFAEPADGPLGFGWMTPYFARIDNGDTWVDGQGLYKTFTKDAAGNLLADTAEGVSLIKTASGFELNEVGVATYTFNNAGKLTTIKDLNNNTVTLSYDADGKLTSVIDASGRQALAFAYNAGNRIATATDSTGRTTTYEYDPFGNLTKATQTGGAYQTYTYNSNHGLTAKANALGETYTIEYQYPDRGVVGKITDPAGADLVKKGQPATGHEMTYAYDFKNGVFYVTDYSGNMRKKTVNSDGALLSEELVEGATTRLLKKTEYLDGRTEKITDGSGNITTIQRDDWNNIVSSTDGEGNVTRIAYTPLKKPLTITDPTGTVTRFDYDASGNLIKTTRAEGKPEHGRLKGQTYKFQTNLVFF